MTKTFNLTDEIADLFTKEEMLAFCEIAANDPEKPAVSGLCKLSKPKQDASSMNYLGVMFVFDTPTKELWQHVNRLTQALEGPALKACLKDLDYVIASPTSNPSPEVFIKSVDCVFKKDFIPDRDYILNELHPALSAVTTLPLGELVWWEEEQPAKGGAATPRERASLFAELKHLIVGPWRGE